MKLTFVLLQSFLLVGISGCSRMDYQSIDSRVDMWERANADRNGNYAFSTGNYKEAIRNYEMVRQAGGPKEPPYFLSESEYKVMIGRLAVAYGVTGQLTKAKAVLEYGLSLDPQNPTFHYNLACYYAEADDFQAALSYLEAALKYRANLLPGDKWPDIKNDNSFKKYREDPRFVKFLESVELGEQKALTQCARASAEKLCECWGLVYDAKSKACLANKNGSSDKNVPE